MAGIYSLGLALLTAIGFLLRLHYLHQPMRYDEAYSYLFFVQVPLASTLSDYSLPNQHILNSLLMRASSAAFGSAPWALRLPAFLFGIAIIPATYLGLRRLLGEHAAFLAAACTAISAQLILYSTNARGYGLVVLLFLAIVGVSTALRDNETEHAWIWLVVLSVVGLYTVPTMLYAIGGVFVWLAAGAWRAFRQRGDRRPLKRIVASTGAVVLLTAILYSPVVVGTGLGPLIANDWVAARSPAQFLSEIPETLRTLWLDWHAGMPIVLVVFLTLGFAAYLVMPRVRRDSGSVVAAILLWCAALLTATMRPPFPRVWLFLLPLYFGVAALGAVGVIGLATPARLRPVLVAGALAIALLGSVTVLRSDVVRTGEGPLFPDAPAVVDYLATQVQPGDGVYVRTPADAPLWYYTWRRGLPDGMLRLNHSAERRVLVVVNEAAGQSIEHLRAVTPLGSARFSAPRLVRRFPSARVYEFTRQPRAGAVQQAVPRFDAEPAARLPNTREMR